MKASESGLRFRVTDLHDLLLFCDRAAAGSLPPSGVVACIGHLTEGLRQKCRTVNGLTLPSKSSAHSSEDLMQVAQIGCRPRPLSGDLAVMEVVHTDELKLTGDGHSIWQAPKRHHLSVKQGQVQSRSIRSMLAIRTGHSRTTSASRSMCGI